MPGNELRLLALDGGGVRGLSSLMILEKLMRTINPESPPKPCEHFDMIGGTSTGGLIAIMLGRLEMTINECIDAYLSMSEQIFQKKAHRVKINGKIQARFDSSKLEQAVKEVVRRRGLPEDTLLKSEGDRTCKVFVCATSAETSSTVCLTSYNSPRGSDDLLDSAKIWEACRATSAASTFFDRIAIGRYGEEFLDGGTGANNPVWQLWDQAQAVYGAESVKDNLDCLVSIGTGVPSVKAFRDDLFHIHKTLISMATETERTAELFRTENNAHLDEAGRYYRFNVARGLEEIGLEESRKKKEIAGATRLYVTSHEVLKQMKACADRRSRGQRLVSKKYHVPFSLRGVPAIEKFVDRPDNSAELRAALLPRHGPRQVFVLSGLGGMGKTQLAAHFARQNHDRYSAVFWLDGSSEDSVKQSIVYASRRLSKGQIPEASQTFPMSEGVNLGGIIDHFLDWLSQEDNNSWLVVFDNVDREYREQGALEGAYDVTRYFAWADHGSVLITTRLGELQQHEPGGRRLQEVDNKLAKAIFCLWYRREFDEDHGNQLLELLGGLPLALTQAAAYMQQTQTNFGQYINLYNNRFRDLMQSQEKNGLPLPKYHSSIWTTWMISFERIQSKDQAAAELLLFWAHLDNQDLWYGLFDRFRERPCTSSSSPITIAPLEQAYSDEIRFNSMMGLLLNYCLVEGKADLSGYVIHPVVHQWARHIQTEEQQWFSAVCAVKIIGYAVPSDSEQNYWVLQRRLLAHAERCYQWVVKDEFKLYGQKEHDNDDDGSGIDQNLQDILTALSGLGNLYRCQGKPNQAEEMYQRVLQGYKEALGTLNHISTLDTIINLGTVYQTQGNLDKAQDMYSFASGGYLVTLGVEHPSTISTSNKIGDVLHHLGELDLAEFHYCQALHWYNKTLGPTHPSTLSTANNLADLYQHQGKLDEAEDYYDTITHGYIANGANITSILPTVSSLGDLYSKQGRLEEAEQAYRMLLRVYEKAVGRKLMNAHIPTLNTYEKLGKLLDRLNKPEEAADYRQRAIVGLQAVSGPYHQRSHSFEDPVKSMGQWGVRVTRNRIQCQEATPVSSGRPESLSRTPRRHAKRVSRGRVKVSLQGRRHPNP